jgi:glycosyltransferase involved in cell wall biosynthesis
MVHSNPNDERKAKEFIEAYEATKEDKGIYELSYLKIKWFYEIEKWKYLNAIAQYYLNIGKSSLAHMCLITSLVENPAQPEIYELAQTLNEKAKPKIPEELKTDGVSVSIIMPTYNRGYEIIESIKSVLNQKYKDYELIIINDGGADGVKEITDSFRSDKIKYYKLKKNMGLSGALNAGILRAQGKYIAYLDDDDVYYPEHLEKLINSFKNNPGYDFVYSNAWWCSGETRDKSYKEKSRKLLERRPRKFDRQLLFQNNYISTLNIMHKKDCFRKVGLFNEDLEMVMDWEMWMRFAHHFNFYQINDITGEYRFKTNNMSAADHLTMTFLAVVIRRFYEANRGKMVALKQYLITHQKEKAEELFEELLLNYPRCSFSTRKELFCLSRKISYWKSRKLYRKMAIDFMKYKAGLFIGEFLKRRFA